MTSHVRFAFDAVHDGDGAGVPDNFDGPTEEGLLEYMMQTKAGDWGAGAAGEGMIIDDVSRINLPLLNPSGLVHHHGQPGGPHEEYSFDEHNKGSVDTRERSTDDELLPDELFQAIRQRVTDPGSVSDPNATHSTGEVSFLESCKVSIERRHTVSSSNDEAIMAMHDRDASSMGDGMGCVENSEYGGDEEAGGMLQKLKRTISAPCGIVQQSSGVAPPKRVRPSWRFRRHSIRWIVVEAGVAQHRLSVLSSQLVSSRGCLL